jgi:hypothetical protein
MYPKKMDYSEKKITLIMGSGVQFLDFVVELDLRHEIPGEFSKDTPLARLLYDERNNILYHPAAPGKKAPSAYSEPVDRSVELFKDIWLPLPFFRFSSGHFDDGPSNWARARIIELREGEDPDGNTHRITFVFDTKVFDSRKDTAYLAPTSDDVSRGASFALAHQTDQMGCFLDLGWVDGWLREVFSEQAKDKLRMYPDDIEQECRELRHQAHYLNLLHVFSKALPAIEIKVVSNRDNDQDKAIPVDMVLDVGNSRTCGILIEAQPQETDGLNRLYELELRDLTLPQHVYPEPFESRIEFALAVFGKDHFSVQSGRHEAFQWPTIARIGREAARLASHRRGTEGSTGLSSPKRYLWDVDSYELGWRFNYTYVKSDIEPHATAAPVAGLINDKGRALFSLDKDDGENMPVFHPRYSRSSLMTFMLCEVLAQALMQINSPSQRLRMGHSHVPRHLRSIVLTVPPSMPKPEREIFTKCIKQAVGLVWKGLGWHPEDDPIEDLKDEENRKNAWPPLPEEVHVQWDEATCAQAVYLFSETRNNFGGRPEEFFDAMARPDRADRKSLSIASIDIGGGTTDLVINDYRLEGDQGSNVTIIPVQRFRDGFKLAGDDILLEVISKFILPPLGKALQLAGIDNPEALLSHLIGNERLSVQEEVLRQQVSLQLFAPLGLRLLKAYEDYKPLEAGKLFSGTFGELLGGEHPIDERITGNVREYFASAVRQRLGKSSKPFDLLAIEIKVSLRDVHAMFISGRMNICKTVQALCEVVHSYSCDVLLLTGRPSRLPGIQALLRKLLPLPPGRILPLDQYRTGPWYPFHKQERIEDPKTTAAVGAMLCLLSYNQRLPNYYFRSGLFRPYSTLKFLGYIDDNNVLKDANVYYRDIDLDNCNYALPDTTFEMRGPLRLGFRQLGSERWSAAPLYILSIINEKLKQRVSQGEVLKVRLGIKSSSNPAEGSETFEFVGAESDRGSVSRNDIILRLNTLPDNRPGVTQYWLDSGSVK